MKIGIDLRALQTGHKYRGIGEVAKQTTNRILELTQQDSVNDISFIFYEYNDDDPKDLLSIPSGIEYKVIKLGDMPENSKATTFEKLQRNANSMYGAPIAHSEESDVFLQFDYAFGVPTNTKTILIKHDLIPYIFWDKYFESAWVPFKNRAARTTLRTLFANHKFKRVLSRSLRNAHAILAVSESTKHDVEKYFHIKPSKTKVAYLGVDMKPAKTSGAMVVGQEYPTKPYLLFVGAGDARRRVEDAVAVFNNLKAEGKDIQLVLVGENFKAPEVIPNPSVRHAVISSSYKNDILTLGYVDDTTKQRLYKDAIAFVYPTQYEGFGIPILESMLLECPIVTYKNSSIPEVGGEYAYYARNWVEMKSKVQEILSLTKNENDRRKREARQYAEKFTWDKTADVIFEQLLSTK
jgi:glycosyltransferase involved in cell wall biosynthesis